MLDRSMKGVFPILSTPTNRKGQTVLEDLKKQVEWMIENGVHGVGIAIASEIYKYSEEERDEISASSACRVKEAAAGITA